MEALCEHDFEFLKYCPWDHTDVEQAEYLYTDDMGCDIVHCPSCGVVYAKRRLNRSGLPKYWGDYLSRVHTHDIDSIKKRNQMYQIEYAFSQQYVFTGKVLDIGCSNGSFLDVYKARGYETFGVDYGKEAAIAAGETHKVRYGVFSEMDFEKEKFDLIIFRGVLQYIPYPKKYLEKAVGLLRAKQGMRPGGYLFITAQPNMNSLAFRLFGKKFTQPVTGADFIGFTEQLLTRYLMEWGLKKVGERYLYPETPYAKEEEDLLKMAKAIQYKREGKEVDFSSPAYWGNMMTLMYTFQ